MAKWQCSTARDLPLAAVAGEWDADAAAARIFTWARWPDDPNPIQARRAFLAYDADNEAKRTAYKIPIADVVDGQLVAIDAAIRSASERLPRTHSIPDDVQADARALLAHYEQRLIEEVERRAAAPASGDLPDEDSLLEAHAAATRANDPVWRCSADRNLPIVSHAWDGPAAKESVFTWAGWPDNPDPARARRAFLIYDSANADLKGSYKLPIAEFADGRLQAVDSGLRAAASRLPQTDAPEDVLERARSVLDAYFEKLNEEKGVEAQTGAVGSEGRSAGGPVTGGVPYISGTHGPELFIPTEPGRVVAGGVLPTSAVTGRTHADLNMGQLAQLMRRSDPLDALDTVFAHPAQVHARQSNAQLQELAIQKHAMDADIFTERPPFFWGAEISSNRLDAYFTRMHPTTTLRNFAQDAAAGVSFQNSHDIRSLGFGRSLTGNYIGPQGNGVARVESDFYTIPGIRLNAISTDDLIYGMRAGIIKDVSVGFFGGRFICSICGRDMLRDWDCFHIPGIEYQPETEDGKSREKVLATASVEDAHLAEVSAVYDGATPGAAVLKAVREADAGRIRPITARLLEARYRIALPSAHHQFAGADLPRSRAAAADSSTRPEPPIAQEEHDMAVREGAGQQPATGTAPAQETPEAQAQPPVLPPATAAAAAREGDGQVAGELLTAELNVDAVLEPVRAALSVAGVPDGSDEVAGITWLVRERERLLPFQSEVATLQQRLAAQEGELERLRPLTTEIDQARAQRSELERLRPLADEVMRLRPLAVEVEELRPLRERVRELERAAEDGQQYRRDLIADALAEGVRAYGPSFAQETYRPVLEAAGLDVIKRMRDDWRAFADRQFAGGRRTIDGAEEPPEGAEDGQPPQQPTRSPRVQTIPDAAYVA